MAVCNRPIDRTALILHLAESMPGVTLQTIPLDEKTTDPLAEIERQTDSAGTGPIMLVGLENAVSSSAGDHPVLRTLNLRREEWARKVPHPVVLWIPAYVLGLLGRAAPDFLDCRRDTLHFDPLAEGELLAFRAQA